MSNFDLFTLSTTTSLSNTDSIFASCEECIQTLAEYCWCWEAQEDDYLQVFIIVLMIILMYLAGYCLGYARSSATIGGISEMNGFCKVEYSQTKAMKADIREILCNKYDGQQDVSGIPIPFYLLFNAILAGIYFAIKVIIYFEDSPHYLSTINQDFNQLSWSEFYDARIILLATIYCHSIVMLHQNMNIYKESREKNKNICFNILAVLCTMVQFVDFLGSIVLMCIKYPLMVTALYHAGIGLIGMIGVAFTCCCLFPLVACYAKCVTLIFSLCVCGSSKHHPCGRFVRGVANGFVLLSINYLFICAVLCIGFAFVGGPNYSVIYLDLSPGSIDLLIVYLYVAASCVGVIGFLIGAVNTIYKQCNDKGPTNRSTSGYHHPRNNNSTEFVEVVRV